MTPLTKRILVTLVVAPLIGLLWLLADGTRPYLKGNTPITLDIPRGARTAQIARQLESAGAIRSSWTFLALHGLQLSNTLKAGEYDFEQPASTLAILRKLVRGDVSYEVLMLPEGSNRFEIADLVAEKGFSTREEFLHATENPQSVVDLDPEATSLEGYLFPDTYLFDSAGTPEDHLNRISNNFNDKFDAKLQKDLLAQDVRNDTAIKIASLIERETGSDEDKPIIAGIIWNRLNTDMKLQIDATSQYILGQPGNWWPRIKPADHKRESPYNTYLFQGLPPGPISNPSLASIKAVVYPAQTDCLYYIHDRNKSIHCSRNYEGHLENIEKYLKN